HLRLGRVLVDREGSHAHADRGIAARFCLRDWRSEVELEVGFGGHSVFPFSACEIEYGFIWWHHDRSLAGEDVVAPERIHGGQQPALLVRVPLQQEGAQAHAHQDANRGRVAARAGHLCPDLSFHMRWNRAPHLRPTRDLDLDQARWLTQYEGIGRSTETNDRVYEGPVIGSGPESESPFREP